MPPLPTAHVPLPDLAFDGDSQPYSAQFGDVYFSRGGGVAETEHVFLRGNDLPARWMACPHFVIGELGFGTGLNFLVTWAAFLRTTQAPQHLHFVSVEQYPLMPEMLAKIHEKWITDAEKPLLNALLANYPLRLPGWHHIHLERCTLTLGFGDAAELLSGLHAAMDAWFIDGFSPVKNPDMWSAALVAELARLSAPAASFATFTAAGAVKRQLQAHRFSVEKVKGFGHKRDMLVGQLVSSPAGERDLHLQARGEIPSPQQSPYRNTLSRVSPPPHGGSKIFVIGAGIAGITIARALAERGVAVTVLERGAIAGGASGNPAAVLYPQLTKFYTPATAWHFTGYSFMLRQIAHWREQGLKFSHAQPGMLRLPRPEQRTGDFARLQMDASIMRYVDRDEAAALAGMEVVSDGWWFPHGSWISPQELCRALAMHPNIHLREQCEVQSVQNHSADAWRISLTNGEILTADSVVVANAHAAAQLLASYTMPMGVSAGQVSMLKADEPGSAPQCIISHRGYIVPLPQRIVLGATYDRTDMSGAVTATNHAENLAHAQAAVPHWPIHAAYLTGRTSMRATTPDRLPYVGEIAPDLYVSIGHGSRGMISAPLAAEIIAAQMLGTPVPLSAALLKAIHPLRRDHAK